MGGDWWTPMDSEPSLGSTTQLQVPQGKGPEFAHSIVELEGPFTNVTKGKYSVMKFTRILYCSWL